VRNFDTMTGAKFRTVLFVAVAAVSGPPPAA
jgi:hypothetical protein